MDLVQAAKEYQQAETEHAALSEKYRLLCLEKASSGRALETAFRVLTEATKNLTEATKGLHAEEADPS